MEHTRDVGNLGDWSTITVIGDIVKSPPRTRPITAIPTGTITLSTSISPGKSKRKQLESQREDEDTFMKSLEDWKVNEERSTKIWVHLSSSNKLVLSSDGNGKGELTNSAQNEHEDKQVERESLITIFSQFGEIVDFYLPISVKIRFCLVEYGKLQTANKAIEAFQNREKLEVDLLSRIHPKELKDGVQCQLSKITNVELASERGLLYSKRVKKRRTEYNAGDELFQMDEEFETKSNTSLTGSGFVDVNQLSQMENLGEDISDFQIPDGSNISLRSSQDKSYNFL